MVIAMSEHEAKFQVGQIVHHKLFDYFGVVFDVDPEFQGTDDWYQHVARSRPPKDEPWYHVLVNEAVSTTNVAEQNLERSAKPQRILHPLTDRLFGPCQRKLGWEGRGSDLASRHVKTQSIQVLQNQPRNHPPGSDALRSVSAFAPERGRFAS